MTPRAANRAGFVAGITASTARSAYSVSDGHRYPQRLQFDCIACAACIDACDAVMTKSARPTGWCAIRRSRKSTGTAPHPQTSTLIYASILMLLVSGFVYAVAHRSPVALDVIRDRNTLYRSSMTAASRTYSPCGSSTRISTRTPFACTPPGSRTRSSTAILRSASRCGGSQDVVVRVRIPPAQEHGGRQFTLLARASDDPKLTGQPGSIPLPTVKSRSRH